MVGERLLVAFIVSTGRHVATSPLASAGIALSRRYVGHGLELTVSLYADGQIGPARWNRPGLSSAWVNWMTASLRPRLTGW